MNNYVMYPICLHCHKETKKKYLWSRHPYYLHFRCWLVSLAGLRTKRRVNQLLDKLEKDTNV